MRSVGWYRKTFGPGRLNRMPPVVDCSHYVRAEISSQRGKVILLVSVDNAGKIPKSLPYSVQYMLPGWEPNVNKSVLLGDNGRVLWSRSEDSQAVHKNGAVIH